MNTFGYVGGNPLKLTDPTGLFYAAPSGAGSSNGASGTDAGGVFCRNGNMSPEVWGFSDCLKDCAIEHEQSHIKDILRKNGNVCKRKDREGWRVVASSTSESRRTERKGYGAEYQCLAAKLEKECEDGPCYSEILKRMTFVLTQKNSFY